MLIHFRVGKFSDETLTAGYNKSDASPRNNINARARAFERKWCLESLEPRVLLSASYVVTDIGSLGGAASYATALNNSGQVVGTADTSSGATHAFLYSPDGSMTDLGILPGFENSSALGINNNGEVVGGSFNGTNASAGHAFIYSPDTGMIDLQNRLQETPLFQGGTFSSADSVNDAGVVVGAAADFRNASTPFIYSPGAITQSIAAPAGANYPEYDASAVNNSSQVVGGIFGGNAYVYTPGSGTTGIGQLALPPGTGLQSGAWDINDLGQIVGQSSNYNYSNGAQTTHPFLYTPASGMIDLGTLPGNPWAVARAINNDGIVVGYSGIDTAHTHGFIYEENAMADLNNLLTESSGWTILTANDINDHGLIAATGSNPSVNGGVPQALLLSPVSKTGIASRLDFVLQPTNTHAGSNIVSTSVKTPAITVRIEDAEGNLVITDHSTVTLSLGSGPAGAFLNGVLTAPVIHGLATFTHLSLSLPGDYALLASDSASTVASATSQAFNIAPAIPVAAVTGQGLSVSPGADTPSADNGTDFGAVLKGGTAVSRTFVITNSGTAALNITGAITAPTGFSVVQPVSTTIVPGGAATFTIILTSVQVGAFSGVVTMPTNDPENSVFSFNIAAMVTAVPSYSITDMGHLAETQSSTGANNINNKGLVVGFSYADAGNFQLAAHAFVYGDDLGLIDLGTLPGDNFSQARDVNSAGVIIGISYSVDENGHGPEHAFVTDGPGAPKKSLGALPGLPNTMANAINASKIIVGYGFSDDESAIKAFVYSSSKTSALTIFGSGNSAANDINDAGQIVGWGQTSNGFRHAFVTKAGGQTATDLGTLGGSESEATGINASGQIVGVSQTGDGHTHAFLYSPGGGMTDLGTLPGDVSSFPYAINDKGWIVGYSVAGDGSTRKFLFTPGAGMVDLATLIPSDDPNSISSDVMDALTRGSLTGINNSGQIVFENFLLTPTEGVPTDGSGTISGVVFDDANGDGVKNTGELGIPGVTVLLKTNGAVLASAVTGTSGEFIFDRLSAGTYAIQESVPDGQINTVPSDENGYQVVLSDGQKITSKNFSNEALPVDDLALPLGGSVKLVSYTQADGTNVRVTLTGLTAQLAIHGTSLVAHTINGNTSVTGAVDSIDVAIDHEGGSSASTLSLTTSKPTKSAGLPGNGVAKIGAISGDILGALKAPSADLVGTGLNFTGFVGSTTLRDLDNGAGIRFLGAAPKPIAMAYQIINTGSDIASASAIGVFKANQSALGVQIDAPAIGTLTTASLASRGAHGDWGADLHLTGVLASPNLTLGTVKITGTLTGGVWAVDQGNTGVILVGDVVGDWVGTFAGSVAAFSSNANFTGHLTAQSVGSLNAKLDLHDAVISLFPSPIAGSSGNALGTTTVGRSIIRTRILSSGNVGAVSALSMTDSDLFAGVVSDDLPTSLSMFSFQATIASVTVKGFSGPTPADAFVNSNIAAATLKSVSLRNVRTNNDGKQFGVSAENIVNLAVTQGKTKYTWPGKWIITPVDLTVLDLQ